MIRKLLLALTASLFLATFLAAGPSPALAQQEQPKSAELGWIEGKLIRYLESLSGYKITIGESLGSLLGSITYKRITLADADGVFARIAEVRLDWSARRLLSGEVQINEFRISDMELLRLPRARTVQKQDLEPPKVQTRTVNVPFINTTIELPISFNIKKLALERIRLAPAVAGAAAAFTLAGRAYIEDDASVLDIDLTLTRISGAAPAGRIRIKLPEAKEKQPRPLTIDINLRDDPGGLITRAIGLKATERIEVTVAGNGPTDQWRGRFEAAAGDIARFASTIEVSKAAGGHRVRIDGKGTSALLSGDLAVFGREIGIVYDATYSLKELVVNELSVTGEPARVSFSGRLPADGKTALLKGVVVASDLAKLQPLIGLPFAGAGRIEVTVSGSTVTPDLAVTGRVGKLTVDRFTVSDARLDLQFKAAQGAEKPGIGALTLNLRADGAAVRRPDGSSRPLDGLSLAVAGDVNWPARSIDLKTLDLKVDKSRLVASGKLARLTPLQFSGTVKFTGDLPEDILGGPAIAGANLSGDVSVDQEKDTGKVKLTGRIARLTTGDRALDALAGGAVEINIDAAQSGERIEVAAFSLSAGELRVRGAGTLSRAEGNRFRLTATIPSLEPLSEPAGVKLRGAVELAATIAGRGGKIDADVSLKGDGIVVRNLRLGQVTLALDAKDVAEDTGSADIRLTSAGGQWDSNFRARLRRESADVVRIALNRGLIGGARVTANGRLTLSTGLFDGQLRLAAGSLWRLLRPFGVPAAGSLYLAANLRARGGRQTAWINATGRKLRYGFGKDRTSVEQLRVRLGIADLRNFNGLSGTVSVAELTSGGTEVPQATVRFRPGPGGTGFRVTGRTVLQGQPTRVNAAGIFRRGGGYTRVQLAALDLRLRRQRFTLLETADLRFGPGLLAARNVHIRTGGPKSKGRVRADYLSRGGRVSGQVVLDKVPARLLQLAGLASPAHGEINGRVDFRGTAWRPVIAFDVRAAGVRRAFAPANSSLSLTARGQVASGNITAEGSVGTAGSRDRLQFQVKSLKGRGGGTEARVTGKIDMQSLSNSGLFWAHRIAGILEADLTITSGAGAPQATGTVRLTGGRFEHAATGAVFKDLEIVARGQGQQITIVSATGNDGTGGTISATGQLLVNADAGYPFTIDIEAKRAAIARREDLEVFVSGKLKVSKGRAGPVVMSGDLTVDKGELLIPESSGVAIPRLKVIEIRRQPKRTLRGRVRTRRAQAGVAPPLQLRLNVTVSRRLYIRGRGLEAELQGRLQVRGTSAAPQVRGVLRTVRGRLDLLTVRFEFRQGVIRFNRPTLANPSLNLEAVANENGISATILITGTAQRPKFTITSTPVLPQDEILSRLIFGKDATSMTATEALQLGVAAVTLFGPGGGGILNRIRRATGLDVIDVTSGDDGSPRAVAGKYVTDRVLVKVEQGITPNSSAAGVEVEVTRKIRVEAKTTTDGRQRVGIKWRHDY